MQIQLLFLKTCWVSTNTQQFVMKLRPKTRLKNYTVGYVIIITACTSHPIATGNVWSHLAKFKLHVQSQVEFLYDSSCQQFFNATQFLSQFSRVFISHIQNIWIIRGLRQQKPATVVLELCSQLLIHVAPAIHFMG